MNGEIKLKLTNNSLSNRYLMNNVAVGIERALKIKEIKNNRELFDKINSYKEELNKLNDPSLSNPKAVNHDDQLEAQIIGRKVYRLIIDYID